MKRNFFIVFSLLVSAIVMTSCSESDDEEYEFENWKSRNETFFSDIYAKARSAAGAGDSRWKVIRNWSLEEAAATSPDDFIVAEVLESGTGADSPIYSDSVYVHYSGRLMPSVSYSEGLLFDNSYTGKLNTETAVPRKFCVGGVVDGLATALQNMRIGDFWRVYIPYRLGYNETAKDNIPAYSTLVFDVCLVAYYRAGQKVPEWKVKSHLMTWAKE